MRFILLVLILLAATVATQAQTCTVSGQVPIWSTTTGWTCGTPTATPGPLPSGSAITMTVTNDTVTGTIVNRFAKLTGAPSKAIIATTSDIDGAIGVCISGCGTSGSATIAIIGQVTVDFDAATTAGNFVILSTTTNGKAHDGGSAFPTAGATYGRVLSTNGASGSYVMELMTPDVAFQNAGNGKSKPGGSDTQVEFNDNGVFGGDADFTWTKGTNTLSLSNGGSAQPIITMTNDGIVKGASDVAMGGNGSIGGVKLGADFKVQWSSNSVYTGSTQVELQGTGGGFLSVQNGFLSYRWLLTQGQHTNSSALTKTANTTLADIPGTSTPLIQFGGGHKNYSFQYDANFDADATGGFKFAVAYSGSSFLGIEYYIEVIDDATGAIVVSSRQTASGGAAGAVGPTAGHVRIIGTVDANTNGNLTIQFAQNVANGTSTVRQLGARMQVDPLP